MRKASELAAKRERKRLRRLRLHKIRIACFVSYGAMAGAGIYQAMRDMAKQARLKKEEKLRRMHEKWQADKALLARILPA